MPLFATLIASIASALISFFVRFLSFKVAIALASFFTWLAVITAFAYSVHICLSSIYQYIANTGSTSGGVWLKFFWMGLGMLIPANAGAIMSCVGSIWIGTEVYKIRKLGIQNFSK